MYLWFGTTHLIDRLEKGGKFGLDPYFYFFFSSETIESITADDLNFPKSSEHVNSVSNALNFTQKRTFSSRVIRLGKEFLRYRAHQKKIERIFFRNYDFNRTRIPELRVFERNRNSNIPNKMLSYNLGSQRVSYKQFINRLRFARSEEEVTKLFQLLISSNPSLFRTSIQNPPSGSLERMPQNLSRPHVVTSAYRENGLSQRQALANLQNPST